MAARTSISTVGDDFGKFSNLGDQFFDIPNRGRADESPLDGAASNVNF